MLTHIQTFFSRAQEIIKPKSGYFIRIGLIILSFCMVITTALLIVEYFYFKDQSAKMIEMKEDYRNYVVAVKKILNDYHKTKERLEELETMLEEKKNDNEDELIVSQSGFPDGVRVYSSDDEDEQGSSFLLINRELEYLKQGTHDYLKKQKMQHLMNALGAHTWTDYTDQVEQERARTEAQKGRRGRVRNKRYASRVVPRHYDKLQASGSVAENKRSHDMSFAWPIDRSNFWLSSFFGPRKLNGKWKFHSGIDMAAVKGTPVKAAAQGIVVEARYAQGYGKTVVIAHTAKYKTRYAHLNSILVKVGQKVNKGDRIGRVGATGFVRSKRGGDASHLHFEVYVFGKQVNPMYFLG